MSSCWSLEALDDLIWNWSLGGLAYANSPCWHSWPWHPYISCRFLSAGLSYLSSGRCNPTTHTLCWLAVGAAGRRKRMHKMSQDQTHTTDYIECFQRTQTRMDSNTFSMLAFSFFPSILHLFCTNKSFIFLQTHSPTHNHTALLGQVVRCFVLNYWWSWALFLEGRGRGGSAFRNTSWISPGAKASGPDSPK